MAKEIALKMLRNKPKGVSYQDNFLGDSILLMMADKRIPISKIVVDKSGSIYRLHGYRYESGYIYWHSREMVEVGHQYCLRVTATYGSLKRKNKNLKHIQTRLDKKAEKRLREAAIHYIERK